MTIDLLTGLLYLAMAAVLVVLGFGIFQLARTGEKARSRSNQLMRLRVSDSIHRHLDHRRDFLRKITDGRLGRVSEQGFDRPHRSELANGWPGPH